MEARTYYLLAYVKHFVNTSKHTVVVATYGLPILVSSIINSGMSVLCPAARELTPTT